MHKGNFKCVEFKADKDKLSEEIGLIFGGKNRIYFQSESTDEALIGVFKENFEITDRLFSLRVFCPECEIYAIRDGELFNVRVITEDDSGKSTYVKDQLYLLRESPLNLDRAKKLSYREYYSSDEDGFLKLESGRFYDLEVEGN